MHIQTATARITLGPHIHNTACTLPLLHTNLAQERVVVDRLRSGARAACLWSERFQKPAVASRVVVRPGLSVLTCDLQDDGGAVIVKDLTEIKVQSPEEIFTILARSFRRRATSETQMNQFSSRSHSIFTVNVRRHRVWCGQARGCHGGASNDRIARLLSTGLPLQVKATIAQSNGAKVTKASRLNFVDLSGSENLKRRCVTVGCGADQRRSEPARVVEGVQRCPRCVVHQWLGGSAANRGVQHQPWTAGAGSCH